jgi:hypothetical protein
MLIPCKHSGYQAGIRLYPGGGGGGTGGPGTGGSIGGGGMGSAANGGPGEGGGFGGGNPGQNVTNPTATTTNTTATTTPTYSWNSSPPVTNPFSSQQIQSAIDTSRQQGFSNQDILTGLSRNGVNSGPQQNAVMAQVSGARPSSSDPQFYQPVYQGQYQNYATTNPLGVSQYGTQQTPQSMVDSAYAGIGRYGSGSGVNQVDQAGRQYWNNQLSSGAVAPQDFNKSFNSAVQQYQTQNPNSALTQYTQNQPGYSGGYGGYAAPQQAFTANNPFNAYTGSAYSPQQMQNAIATSQQQGFSSQDIATGLARNGVYLSPQQTQMYNPFTQLQKSPSQTQIYSPQRIQSAIDTSRQQGFSDQDIMTGLGRYNVPTNIASNAVYGGPPSYQSLPQQQYQQPRQPYDQGFVAPQQQYQPPQPLTYSMAGQQQPTQAMMQNFQQATQNQQMPAQQYQPQQSYGGQQATNMGLGFGGGQQPQQQYNPYQQYQPQQPYDQGFVAPQQPVIPTSSGPSQAIVGRSSMGRGTPNVMRRAEGGIIDLMDKT